MFSTSPQAAPEVPWTGRDLGRALLLVLAVIFFSVLALSWLAPPPEEVFSRSRALLALAATATIEASMLGSLWLFALRRHGATWQAIGYRRMAGRRALSAIPLSVLLAFGGLSTYSLVVRSLGLGALQPSGVPEAFLEASLLRPPFLLLATVVAPLTEEGFFRGFAFTALQPRWGTWGAALGSSLLFGLAHASLGLLLPTVVLGLLLVYLFRRTGSLWSCAAVHGGFNTLSIALAL